MSQFHKLQKQSLLGLEYNIDQHVCHPGTEILNLQTMGLATMCSLGGNCINTESATLSQ
jgi:hypothetical protein